MGKSYNHETNIICPHCGYEDYDSWEFSGNPDEEVESFCSSCSEEILVTRNVQVSYSTRKIVSNNE